MLLAQLLNHPLVKLVGDLKLELFISVIHFAREDWLPYAEFHKVKDEEMLEKWMSIKGVKFDKSRGIPHDVQNEMRACLRNI